MTLKTLKELEAGKDIATEFEAGQYQSLKEVLEEAETCKDIEDLKAKINGI